MDSDDDLSGSSLFETDSEENSSAHASELAFLPSPHLDRELQLQESETEHVDGSSVSAMDRRVRRRQHEQEQPTGPNHSVTVDRHEIAAASQQESDVSAQRVVPPPQHDVGHYVRQPSAEHLNHEPVCLQLFSSFLCMHSRRQPIARVCH
jgi:hypothetical protein